MSVEEHGSTLLAESVHESSAPENSQSVRMQSLDDEIRMRRQENKKAEQLNWNLTKLVEQEERECEMLRREILEESQRQPLLQSSKLPTRANSKEGLTVEMLQGLQKIRKEFESIEQEHSALTLQSELPSLKSRVQTQRELASEMKAACELQLDEYLNREPPQPSPLDTLLQDLRVEKTRLDEERRVKKRELERAWYFAPPSCAMPSALQQKEQ